MLRNYLLVTVRHVRTAPLITAINVAGLAIGLTCCAFILAYVVDELSFERFHEHADRIVRIVENRIDGSVESRLATTYGPLAPALEDDFADVERTARFMPYSVLVSSSPTRRYQEDGFAFVDPSFLDLFSFDVAQGGAIGLLDAPFTALLTESAAQRYFGTEDPVGSVIEVRDDDDATYDFTVTGIVEDPPHNTHLQFEFLASFSSMRVIYGDWIDDPRNWEHPPLYTYALLRPGVAPLELEARLGEFARRRMGADRTMTRSLHVEPLTRIRLYSNRQSDIVPGSDVAYVYLLGAIGLLILVVASINFVNLTTARTASRIREIGVRKAIGARRSQLVRQFLSEAMLTTLVAASLSVVLVGTLFPIFRSLSGKALTLDVFASPWTIAGFALVCGIAGLGAGCYPALHLSSLDPTSTLRGGRPSAGIGGASLVRKGLVVFQFAVSITLLIATSVVFRQLAFMQDERLGFDKEHVVIVPIRELNMQMKSEALTEEWTRLPGVLDATVSSGMPGLPTGLHDFWMYPEGTEIDSVSMQVLTVDHRYAETYGLNVVAGRDFSQGRGDDVDAFLVNESAAERLGWTEPVGKRLKLRYYFYGEQMKTGTVVGVIEDFQYGSMHRAVEPIVFHILPGSYYYDYASARLDPSAIPQTLEAMEAGWQSLASDRPFEYRFLDDQFDALYRAEQRLGRLFGIFAVLAVLTACLGLFGLSALTMQQRTKEIGIRKVLGAGVPSIVMLVTKDFVRMVAIAFGIAVPFCILLMNRWLEQFADRISLSVEIFLAAGAACMIVALIAVSYHAVRSALTDPVRSLRYE